MHRNFPTRQGAKRREKDEANQWIKELEGRGPSKTRRSKGHSRGNISSKVLKKVA